MRRIWTICWFEMQRVFKRPSSYALMFGMPLIFTFVFGMLLGEPGQGKTKLAVVDQDQTMISKSIVNRLTEDEMLAIQQMSQEEADAKLRDRSISGIITVPSGLQEDLAAGDKAEIAFRHGPDLAVAAAIRQTIGNAMAQSAVQMQAVQTWRRYSGNEDWMERYERLASPENRSLVSVEAISVMKNETNKRMSNLSERAVGFSVMFMMITLLISTGTILEARKIGVWYRMLSAPVSRIQILGGYLLSFFLVGWIQFGVLMSFTSFLFGVEWGDPLGQIVLVSALLLCMVGLGLFIAGLVRTQEQQAALGNILIVSTCMLGGVYWPLDIVPDFMKRIAEFVPQTWAMKGFTELIARGGSVVDVLGSVAVLLGFAAVFLTAGISRVRYE